jgi:hypothetical protein
MAMVNQTYFIQEALIYLSSIEVVFVFRCYEYIFRKNNYLPILIPIMTIKYRKHIIFQDK